MPTSPSLSKRGRANALKRYRSSDDPELLAAQRDLRAARLEEHVLRVVDEAPPLSDEQRARIARLLQGSGDTS